MEFPCFWAYLPHFHRTISSGSVFHAQRRGSIIHCACAGRQKVSSEFYEVSQRHWRSAKAIIFHASFLSSIYREKRLKNETILACDKCCQWGKLCLFYKYASSECDSDKMEQYLPGAAMLHQPHQNDEETLFVKSELPPPPIFVLLYVSLAIHNCQIVSPSRHVPIRPSVISYA